jgi:TolA-binding protein
MKFFRSWSSDLVHSVKLKQCLLIKLCVLLSSVFLMPGCVTAYRMLEIETRVVVLESKLDQLKKEVGQQNESQNATLEHMSTEFKRFNKEILSIIDNLRKGSAEDIGDIVTLKELIQKQQGELSELHFKLSQMKPGEQEEVKIPAGKEQLYQQAEKLLLAKSYREAIRLYSEFVKRHPEDVRADDSLYHIAEAYYQQGRYEDCARAIQQIINEYGDENQADKALVLLSDTYLAMDQCTKGRDALIYLKDKYPRSNQQRIADRKLKQLRCK